MKIIKKVSVAIIAFCILISNFNVAYANTNKDGDDSDLFSVTIITGEEAKNDYLQYNKKNRYTIGDVAEWRFAYDGEYCASVFLQYDFYYSEGDYVEITEYSYPETYLLNSNLVDNISNFKMSGSGTELAQYSFTYKLKSKWAITYRQYYRAVSCDCYGNLSIQ